MIINVIDLSPTAAGTLKALTDSWQVSKYTGRKFRMGPAVHAGYQELVAAGFAEAFPVGPHARYELLHDVDVPEPEFVPNVRAMVPVVLTDEQRDMLAREIINDRKISELIANGKYESKYFGCRCLGNYA